MKISRSIFTAFLLLIITLTVTSCDMPFARATPTPLPTATSTPPPTATPTLTPTITLTNTPWRLPTTTIDATATEQYSRALEYFASLAEDGYLPSMDGTYRRIDNYSNQWAQLSWYQWHNTGWKVKDFALTAHMAWSSDFETPNPSGCGIVFRIQDTNEHYVVFLLSLGYVEFAITTDKVRSQPWVSWGSSQNEGEADFTLVAVGEKVDVFVNKKHIKTFIGYRGKWEEGQLGFTTLSGTNAGYGTQCDITNADLWLVRK